MCIDEVTAVMQDMAKDSDQQSFDFLSENNVQKDFTADDLCILKAMFLELEKAVDSIELKNHSEGDTFPGGFIFELLEKVEVKIFNLKLIYQSNIRARALLRDYSIIFVIVNTW